MIQIPLRLSSMDFHFHFICLQDKSCGCGTMRIFKIILKVIMPGNHAPMSLQRTRRGGGSIKRIVPFPEHMPMSWANCFTFLFSHHELRRDASILDVEDLLVCSKLRLLCYKRIYSMFDSLIRYFRWYYLHNESFRTLKGFHVKSGYDTQSNGIVFIGFPTPLLHLSFGQELRLWFTRGRSLW